jgi:peptide deformylase
MTPTETSTLPFKLEIPQRRAIKPSNLLELVPSSDPIIKTPVDPFNFKNTTMDPIALAETLIEHVDYYGGVGLSANQLGLPYRVFVMASDPKFVCFNPRITAFLDKEEEFLEEGCLTYPGLVVKVKRRNGIRVVFQDPYGNICTKQFYGMTARVFQHELDHLDGKTILDRANRFHKEQAIRKWKKNASRKAT